MNRSKLDDMWDECRDEELSGARRRAFDEHMLGDAELRALWGAESRWLAALKCSEASTADAADPGFSRRVVAQWDEARRRRARVHRFWRRGLFAVGGAAAAALVTLVTWVYQGERLAEPGITGIEPDPVTVLVGGVAEQVQTQPEYFYDAVRDTRRLLTVERALRMFVVPLPPGEPESNPGPRSPPRR